MGVSVYLNFDGNCREALEHYAKVFGSKPARVMTYGDAPPNPAFPMDDAAKKRVMHAELEAAGGAIMLSDLPPGDKHAMGNAVTLIVQSADPAEITRWYNGMKEGGEVEAELGPQFFSKLYGFVKDRFGLGWQFNLLGEPK